MTDDPRARLRRELLRAPTGGLTAGEIAILMIDVDDDLVTLAIEQEIEAGRVTDGVSGPGGLVRYYLVDAPATAVEFGIDP